MTIKPYPFQKRVAELLLEGHNVILQAPTGSGKTMAALLPFLDAIEQERDFPRKCLYAVPLRVLANQFVLEYRKVVERAGRDDKIHVAIQTGEQSEDREFTATLTFATIDQVLSSFLLSPYSLPRRLSNLNAGAIAASYLVFDEFHLFDPLSTLPTTLEMLKMLRGVTPFLLMTATFSGDMLDGLAKQLDAVIVPGSVDARDALQTLPSQHKTRRYHVVNEPLSAEAVLNTHKKRTLVVCNVVDRARMLFESLRDHPDLGETKVILLHSRFLSEDRKRIEDQIQRFFGKGGDTTGSWIVVATQVIEVGLDITCEVLHTELAPANSLLQRAGRCARYEKEEGDVYIYSEAYRGSELVALTEHAWPYQGLKGEVQRTWDVFCACNGASLTFADEQTLVSEVHGPRDCMVVQGLIATREMHRRRMNMVMDGQRSAEAGDLIRAISSRRVVVHDDADAVIQSPFLAEAFSLHPSTLFGQVKRWREAGLLADGTMVRTLVDPGDKGEDGRTLYAWKPVTTERDIKGAALILVDPALAGYDSDLGFLLDRATDYRAKLSPAQVEQAPSKYSYCLESYEDHVTRVYEVFCHQVWPELATAASRMEQAFGWPAGIMGRAASLVVLFHDVGKLNQGWQAWVQNYQAAIGRPVFDGTYAHTDFDPFNPQHFVQQKKLGRRPSHAVEGATAVAPLFAKILGGYRPLFNAAFTAIARHHGAFTREGQHYTLVEGAARTMGETLQMLPPALRNMLDLSTLWKSEFPSRARVGDFIVTPQEDEQFLAYILLARALRRADQMGTKLGAL